MQSKNLGYLAVSLGFYKTLFSAPGTSASRGKKFYGELKQKWATDGLISFLYGVLTMISEHAK
jgi:methionine-gamma-lyase